MITDARGVLTGKEEILPGIWRMEFSVPVPFSANALPGRFLQVEVARDVFPIVRRPFTVSTRGPGRVGILFQVVGRGTEILAGTCTGTELRLLGPLGNGYRPDEGSWLLIGGGLGAAGFPCLIDEFDCELVLLGAATGSNLIDIGGSSSRYSTEDGSVGTKGMVTDLMDGISWDSFSSIAVCGPLPMLKAVIARIPCEYLEIVQVSTEARMGCGWGACEGCAIPAAGGGYLKCCSDGPVLAATSIDWERWEA